MVESKGRRLKEQASYSLFGVVAPSLRKKYAKENSSKSAVCGRRHSRPYGRRVFEDLYLILDTIPRATSA